MNAKQSKPQSVLRTHNERVSFPRRILFLTMAALFFLLGMIGVVIPGLPTTPFLLLTSYFLARSSPRLHQMFLQNRLGGPMLQKWQEHSGIEPRVKILAILMVVLAMSYVIFCSQLSRQLTIAFVALASVGLLVVGRLPTLKRESA